MSLQRRFKKPAVIPVPTPIAINKSARSTALEKHYSVREVAEMWGLSDDSVRKREIL